MGIQTKWKVREFKKTLSQSITKSWRTLIGFAIPQVTRLLISVNVPDHVVWQTDDLVPCSLGHTSKSLGFGLVFECIGREVDACIC